MARSYLHKHVELYQLNRTDDSHIPLRGIQRLSSGASIVTFDQEVDGIEVFGQSLKVLLSADQQLVAMSGHLSPVASKPRLTGEALRFTLTPREAIAQAWRDLHGQALPPESLLSTGKNNGPYSHFTLSPGPRLVVLSSPVRARKVFYPLPTALVPAWYVELDTTPVTETEGERYAYVISARDGRLLYRNDLALHQSYSYRVWADTESPHVPHDGPHGTAATPHPTGLPDGYQAPFVPPNLVTLRNSPFSRNDPWLPEGATETLGNNVDAYADLVAPNGFNEGDVRATLSAPGTFDFTYDPLLAPGATEAQQKAAVAQLFFVTNFLHDWFYDAGFDEASGNGQQDNYGRGGLDEDPLIVEAQDYSMRNNAMLFQASDGAQPRMQLFIFDALGRRDLIIPPEHPSGGTWPIGVAAFGPQQFNLTAAVAVAQDGIVGPNNGTAEDACEPISNAAEVTGKLAVVDRLGCNFTVKASNAQAAGAVGVIIVNNSVSGPPFAMAGRAPGIVIPVVSVSNGIGSWLRGSVAPQSVTLVRDGSDRDSALDSATVAHEWAHYMSGRLVGNTAGLRNRQGGGLNEGWSDFVALLLMARAEDEQVPSNVNFNGVYAMSALTNSGGTNQGHYWGGRRYPYSTDMTKNPLTLRHIEEGVSLPAGIPVARGADGVGNSQLHATGEVWANMLWECYTALLRDKSRLTFAQAQQRMREYLVASLKLTPMSPTITEARDALLAAAAATDRADYLLFAQAFAKRGAGTRAVAPPRDSTNHAGVVESFISGKDVALANVEVIEPQGSAESCDDDGVFDSGETWRVRVTVRNSGIERLTRTSLTLSSSDPALSFPEGTTSSFPSSEPLEHSTVELPVKLSGVPTQRSLSLTIAYRDEEQSSPGDQTHTVELRVNKDEAPGTSTLETVDATAHGWLLEEPSSPGALPWTRTSDETGTAWHFHGPNNGGSAQTFLVSPPLQVAGALRFTFRHRFSFEADANSFYDGAIIELSADDGETWVDIGESLSLPYNGVISDSWDNPLANHPAYGGESPGYPEFTTTTAELGTAYAGKTVRIRFHIATDSGVSAPGWEVDDLQFEGLASPPFTSVVDHRGLCINRAPVAHAGSEQFVNERRLVTLSGSGTDPEGKPLSYAWTQTAGPAVELSSASAPNPTFRAPEVTEDTDLRFELRVHDGVHTSPGAQVTVRVRNVSDGNRAPVATAETVAPVDEGANVTLSGAGSDPDEDAPLAFAWTQVGGPTVTLSSTTSAQVQFTAPQVASDTELAFQLVVSDGESASTPAVVTVLVRDVARPVARAGEDHRVNEGSQVTLSGAGSTAPEGTALTYAWTQVGGPSVPLSVEGASAIFTAPSVDEDTALTFQLRVTDIHGESSEDTVTVNVVNASEPPPPDSGCGCASGQGSVPSAVAMLLAVLGLMLRRTRLQPSRRKFLASALLLWGAAPGVAHAQESQALVQEEEDRELWITLGAETLEPVRKEFGLAGFAQPAQVRSKNGVTMMKVRESQLSRISKLMHEKYLRCAGFIAHDSEQEARAALEQTLTAPAPRNQVAYTIDNAVTVNALVSELAELNIRGTITTLSTNFSSRYYTSVTGYTSAHWIKTAWQNLATGRPDVNVSLFTHTGYPQPSVILTITGTTFPDEVVVIGGHLDSTSSGTLAPGADDDASGIAVITEIIRATMERGYRPARTVKFMGYAAEEVGLLGSQDIANWHAANGINVVGVLQLDMTNYKGSDVDIGLLTDYTNAAQNAFFTQVVDTYKLATWGNTVCGYGCSDHVSWHNKGFAATMPFEARMNQHNPAIHTPNDTLDRTGGKADHALKFAKVTAAYMAELAKGTVIGPGDTAPPTVKILGPWAGATVARSTTITASASDNVGVTRVDFWVDGERKGSDTTAPYTYAWDTTTVANGNHVLVAKAYDAADLESTSASITVTVSNVSTLAAYDAVLRAPLCATVNSVCDSGTLLDGRAHLGPEPNTSNTLNGTCTDGASGTYHADESNDRLRVSTLDGTPFQAGKTVRIDATVWAYSSYTSDKLDLYYAADANNPTWTFLGTLTPAKAGSQTLVATYALPAGTLQAVRANFRYGGNADTCASGAYTDHDDLIFAVSP